VNHLFATLEEALAEIEAGTLADMRRVVVSREWWDALSDAERAAYHKRCLARGVDLSADDRLSRHYVELVGSEEPPLSSERRT
jgi:hypothetical protein